MIKKRLKKSKHLKEKVRRILSLLLSFGLLFQQISFAQVAAELNIANYLSRIGSSLAQERFRPLHLRYFSYDSLNDTFKLLLDKGSLKNLGAQELESSTKTLLNYFLIGVTLPNDAFWVNLRPDSEDRIIDTALAQTDVGKIMLEADLQLKKDAAKFTSPETPEGREYWNKLYRKAEDLFGYENITIPTLTRPWIIPGEIIIRESQDSAYVYKATLKVMLEQDYLKDSASYTFDDMRSKALNEYSSQLIRELIIPKLTKEVNSSKRYAALRQVYYSLILSRWFKLRFSGKSGAYASLIDTRNLSNLTSREPWSKTEYFKQYQKSFQKGEYNIQEPVYTPTGQVIRSYFSGGIEMGATAASSINNRNGIVNPANLPGSLLNSGYFMEGNPVGMKLSAASPLLVNRVFYKWDTKAKGIQNVSDAIQRNKPVLIKTYNWLNSLPFSPEKEAVAQILREDIYKITHGHFQVWRLGGALDSEIAPYFNGSYITALQEVFPELRLNPLGFHLDWSSKDQGIASVRYILNREKPDIIERYERLLTLREPEKQILREDIYEITSGHFMMWGLGKAVNLKEVPYFNGSHINTLQEVFPLLHLNPLGFQLDWSDRDRGIASIRYVLNRERPDIIKRYERLSTLSELEKQALRQDVYSITSGHFMMWGLKVAIDSRVVPYFNGSYINALAAVFDDPRLGFNEEDLREFRKESRIEKYHWLTKDGGIFNVRDGIELNRPDIIMRYNQFISLPSFPEKEVLGKALRKDIYKITWGYFQVWGLGSAMVSKVAPYFNGSYLKALQEVFPLLNLDPLSFRLDWSNRDRGIASVSYVLNREKPDIIERYGKFSTLSEPEKQVLREDVYKITQGHFLVWRLSGALESKKAPYFNGSYIKALQEVFLLLHLNPLGFQLDWSSKEQGIASVRYVLKKERPDIIERYERLSTLTEPEKQALREEIYNITSGHFHMWELSMATNSRGAPYFNGSHINALQEVFLELELEHSGFVGSYAAKSPSSPITLEKKAAIAFRNFADVCRKDIELMREEIKAGQYVNFESALHRLNMRENIEREFVEPELLGLKRIIEDSLPVRIETLNYMLSMKSPKRDEAFAQLDQMENVLRELEKLIVAGRLLDAKKARVKSGVLDASLVLGTTDNSTKKENWLVTESSSWEEPPVNNIITDSDKEWAKGTSLDLSSLPVGTLVYLGDTGQSIGADGAGEGYPIRYLVKIEENKIIKLWFGNNMGCYIGSMKLLRSFLYSRDEPESIPGIIQARAFIDFPYFKWGPKLLPLTNRAPNELEWTQQFPFFRVLYPEELSKIREVSLPAAAGIIGKEEILEQHGLTLLSLEELQSLLWIFHDEEALAQLQRDPFMRLRKGIYPEKAIISPDVNPRIRYDAFVAETNVKYNIKLLDFDIMRTIFIDILGMAYLQDTKNLRATVEYRLERLLARIKELFDRDENIPLGLSYSHIERTLTELAAEELYRLYDIVYGDVMPGVEESVRPTFPIPEQFDSVIQFLRIHGTPRGQRSQLGSLDDQFLEYTNTLRDYINRVQDGFDKLSKVSQNSQKKITSSPLAQPPNERDDIVSSATLRIDSRTNKLGGIDFRSLPMTIQPMGSFNGLNFKLPQLSRAQLEQINVNSEIQQIKNMLQAGTMPSGERIKEIVAACVQKEEINSYADNLLLCVVDILKMEEENACESSPELKEALVIVDSQS